MLRTGIGMRRSYSRRELARRLRVSLAREGQIEERAVSALRASARSGVCEKARGEAAPRAFPSVSGTFSLLEEPLVGPLLTATTSAGANEGPEQGRHAARSKQRHAVSGVSVQESAIPPLPHPGSSFSGLNFLVLALLVILASLILLAHRWMLRSPAAAASLPASGARLAGVAAAQRRASELAGPPPAPTLAAVAEPEEDAYDRLAAYRRAEAAGDPGAATNLGALLEQRGDIDGALAAYRRADARGDLNGTFNLGCLLAAQGDLVGAVAALRRADERGDADSASNLGVLLERLGYPDDALAAYRRADERGGSRGAFNLGRLLASRGDRVGAQAAYLRATWRGDPEVARKARSALMRLAGLPARDR